MPVAIASQTINAPMTSDKSSTTVAVPSGTADNDLLILFACIDIGDGPFSTLSGWTLIQPQATDGSEDCEGAFWQRTASSEPSSYTVAVSGDTGLISAAMFRITGFDPSSPIRTSALTKTSSAAKPSPAPGTLTGVQASDLVIIGYGFGADSRSSSAPTITYPTTGSWTQLGISGPTHVSNDWQGALAVVSKVAGTDTPTASSSTSGGWVVMSVAVAAAPSSVPTPALYNLNVPMMRSSLF